MKTNDIKNYVAGNKNWIQDVVFNSLDKDFKEGVEARLAICQSCPLFNGERCSSERYALNINGDKVTGCGCKHPKLAYAPEKHCPRGLWENGLKDED